MRRSHADVVPESRSATLKQIVVVLLCVSVTLCSMKIRSLPKAMLRERSMKWRYVTTTTLRIWTAAVGEFCGFCLRVKCWLHSVRCPSNGTGVHNAQQSFPALTTGDASPDEEKSAAMTEIVDPCR